MRRKRTCGPMYKEALELYTNKDPEFIRVFAAGFVSGQAEKVYIGACRAAMFRPSQEWSGKLLEIVQDVAKRYGLEVVHPIGGKQEIWLCRPNYVSLVNDLKLLQEDSPVWHRNRAWLCGIPEREIDDHFHLREGAGERCD